MKATQNIVSKLLIEIFYSDFQIRIDFFVILSYTNSSSMYTLRCM